MCYTSTTSLPPPWLCDVPHEQATPSTSSQAARRHQVTRPVQGGQEHTCNFAFCTANWFNSGSPESMRRCHHCTVDLKVTIYQNEGYEFLDFCDEFEKKKSDLGPK